MPALLRCRYVVRLASSPADLRAVLNLRSLCFRDGLRSDEDKFDAICQHILIEELHSKRLVCTFRLQYLPSGSALQQSYSAQFYDLSGLAYYPKALAELGRFCVHPDATDPDVLRIAWGVIAQVVDRKRIGMLFGCSSFKGTSARPFSDVFTMLGENHVGPTGWLPGVKAPDVVRFADISGRTPDLKRARASLPPMLRFYLTLGAWVSDHAVLDETLGTLHVFTGLEISAIPAVRKNALMAYGRRICLFPDG